MPDSIQAKVTVDSVKDTSYGNDEKYAEEVTMRPVYGNGEENKSYSEATPNGLISLTITNKQAWGFFVAGQEYYVNFQPA